MGLDCGGTSRSNSDDTGYSCEIHVKLVDDYISPGQFGISGCWKIGSSETLHATLSGWGTPKIVTWLCMIDEIAGLNSTFPAKQQSSWAWNFVNSPTLSQIPPNSLKFVHNSTKFPLFPYIFHPFSNIPPPLNTRIQGNVSPSPEIPPSSLVNSV